MTVPQHVFLAARTGDITVLREYFASGDRDPNDVAWNGWTLLDGACRGTRDEVAAVDWGGTPRVISCEVVSFLLSQGASVDYHRKCQDRGLSPAATRREVDEQTVEDWCRAFMDQERWRREPTLKFLIALRAAGGTMKGYLWAPRADLCMLRLLCEQGRASPRLGQIGESMNTVYGRVVDREERDLLERVFAWAPGHATDSRRRTRSAQAAVRASHITPLPRGVFKLVLSFWESDRDWRWGY